MASSSRDVRASSRQSREPSSSPPASPTSTRPTAHFDTTSAGGRDDGLSESFQSTDTVRRRFEPSYGTALSPPAQPTSSPFPTAEGTPTTERAHHHRPGTGQSILAIRSPMLAPDRGRSSKPRKPPMSRRPSSNAQAPHRGGVFSVDDALDEVEADQAQRQTSFANIASIRRRTAAPNPPSLSRVRSHHRDERQDEDADEEQPEERQHAHLPHGEAIDPPEDHDPGEEEDLATIQGIDERDMGDRDEDDVDDQDDEDDGDVSDAESFTLKDRQQAINETHPFGIRLWKPALYKKDRSVQKTAEGDIHSSPGGRVSRWLLFFNVIWTLCFGWWMALIAFTGAIVCFLFAAAPSGREYGRVLWGLSGYLFYPFGQFIRLEQQDPYLDEDQGEGRSITEYEQWQSGDLEYGRLYFGPERHRSIVGRSRRSIDSEPSETDSLLGRMRRGDHASSSDPDLPRTKRRLFGRGQWNIGRVIFFVFFYSLITPSLFLVSAICWFLVFWIPMGKVTMLLFDHLRRHPLALSFESGASSARAVAAPHSSIIVCTYRAVGSRYWKYTVDGTNIFLINLMAVVIFVIFDWLVLESVLHLELFVTSPAFLFVAGLFSIIPLAYFIGQAVASISAQSSMGFGAAINAFFSTIVEVFLYCVALRQGKGQLVEGSIVGSVFAGILFLPGLSMCFGAIKRKTQRFNARSAGVTSTMLLFAVIGAFSPTLFYQIYGTHELNCLDCVNFDGNDNQSARDCRRCYFNQTPALDDRFYLETVRPYCFIAAGLLFLSYVIGLWFTLRTHAAVIWNTEVDEKKQEDMNTLPRSSIPMPAVGETSGADIRDSHLYKRILGQSLKQAGLPRLDTLTRNASTISTASMSGIPGHGSLTPHLVPPKTADLDHSHNVHITGLTDAQNTEFTQQVAEMAATAAAIAARDATHPLNHNRRASARDTATRATLSAATPRPSAPSRTTTLPDHEPAADPTAVAHAGAAAGGAGHGGHDAPNWSRLKSAIILMGATVLYAIIAEILVDTVDVVLEGFAIDEKFLGITLFALVPNTTEFLNAISFAMNGNIALSMEIGSAYALQVCLLQIPALVLYSALSPGPLTMPPDHDLSNFTFSLLFPQWDMVTVILCVFLLSYMYGEGKSNYFKGSILLLSYLVVVVGFFFSGMSGAMDARGGVSSRFDKMGGGGEYVAYGSEGFRTVGRGSSGAAF